MATLLLLIATTVIASAAEDLEALVRKLGEKDANRRMEAYRALVMKRDPKVVPLLVAALPGFEENSQHYGMLVLEGIRPRHTKGAFRKLLKSEASYLRFAAALSLLRFGESGMAARVVAELAPEGLAPNRITLRLGRLYQVHHPVILAAVRSLLAADRHPMVVGTALWTLQRSRDPGAPAAVRKLLADDRQGVRAMAAAFLYAQGETDRAADLAAALRAGGYGSTELSRVRSLLGLVRGLPAVILDALTSVLDDPKADTAALTIAIDLLAKARHRKAIPALKRLLEHEQRRVAKAAFDALAGLSGALTPETLLPMLAAKDRDRGLWAADVLRRMDDHAGLPIVLSLLEEGSVEQRREAAKSLGGFRVAEGVEPLLRAMLDEDTTVRMYAATSLGALLRSLLPYRRTSVPSTGYTHTASPDTRRQAVEKLRLWISTQREKGW